VNAVDMMTRLIDLSRQFDMHTTMMKSIQDNATKANEILALPK
jgi:flagellar basal-body rod protein FlgF